jgi:hypothetical protein
MKPQLQRITTTLEKIDQEYHSKEIKPSYLIKSDNLPQQKPRSVRLSLPKVKPVPLSNHHNAPNPALARNILQEIDGKIAQWQENLYKVQQEIQDLYLEGPIVDGWLESQAQTLATDSTSEDICQGHKAGYRLSCLDENGRLWSRDCPSEQVAELSMAIARYHRLKELLYKKRQLETRLKQIAETLAILHSNITGNTKS